MQKSLVLEKISPYELFLMSNFGSDDYPNFSFMILDSCRTEDPKKMPSIDKRIQDNILKTFPYQLEEYKPFLNKFNMVYRHYGCSLYSGLLYLVPCKNVKLMWLQEEKCILEIRSETSLITKEKPKQIFPGWKKLIH